MRIGGLQVYETSSGGTHVSGAMLDFIWDRRGMMNLVKALNAISSQIWAVVLILLGMGTFAMACGCHVADIRAAFMSSGTGMIGGGIAMFQHQPKDEPGAVQPPA